MAPPPTIKHGHIATKLATHPTTEHTLLVNGMASDIVTISRDGVMTSSNSGVSAGAVVHAMTSDPQGYWKQKIVNIFGPDRKNYFY